MDSTAALQAMRDGDLNAWIKAQAWDEIHSVTLPACPCGETPARESLLARNGVTLLVLVPGNEHGTATELRALVADDPERAHFMLGVLVTGSREIITDFEARVGVEQAERYANTV